MLEYAAALGATTGASVVPPAAALRVLASKACRRAIKFGDTLDQQACQRVLTALARCDLPFQCAHGRPTIVPIVQLQLRNRGAQTAAAPSGTPMWACLFEFLFLPEM